MGHASAHELTALTGSHTVPDASQSASRLGARSLGDGERVAGRYVVEGLLGRGGSGEVYRVSDEEQGGRQLALKVARIDADHRELETLRSEFALLATLNHPHLARVYDFGQLGRELAFFTQDLAPGVPLDQTDLRLDDPIRFPFWAQLCRALEYLHSRGILHRDIKPSNILVDVAGERLTLLDFGIARALGANDTVLSGTWAYMPPEAIAGAPLDARADLYSLGVTFYRSVAGRLPFTGGASELLVAHVSAAPDPLPATNVAAPVARLVERLLAKEPGDRPASAREVLETLAKAVGAPPDDEPPESLASYVLSGRFVGDTELCGRLRAHCFVSDPRGEALVMTGEAGSGKSRLLRELRQRAQLAGRVWIQVDVRRTWALKSVLHSIAQAVVVDEVAEMLDDDDRRELARALPALRRPRERIGAPLDPERARELRILALGRALQLRFADAPGVLVVDDVHWADPDVLELLQRVVKAARSEGARCAFVLSSRPTEGVAELGLALDAERLGCGEIGPDAAGELITSMFGQAELLRGTELGARLETAPHTAQHVQESLRLALDSGAIVRRDGLWRVVGSVAAPPLAEVLSKRCELLRSDSRGAALATAVLGGEATGPEVADVTGQSQDAAGVALRDLVRAGILEERLDVRGRAAYAMHDRLRDVVLASASPAARVRAHRRAAVRLKRNSNGDFRVLMDAADHFAAAGDKKRAIRVAAESADIAEKSGRPDRAAAATESEIRWRLAIGERCVAAWLRRFDLCTLAGMRDAADEAEARLQSLAGSADPSERVAISVRRARVALERGDLEAARAEAESSLPAASEIGDARLLSELHWTEARADELYGAMDSALLGFERAAGHAEQAGEPRLEAKAWLGASLAALFLGSTTKSRTFAERSLKAARGSRDGVAVSDALRCLGNAAREALDLPKARKFYQQAVRTARESGSLPSEAKALNNLGTLYQWFGQVEEADAAMLRALRLKERLGLTASALLTRNNLGQAYLSSGRLDEARIQFSAIIESGTQAEPTVFALAHSNFGDLCLLEGRLDDAVELYLAAHRMNRARANDNADAHALSGLIRTLLMRDGPGDFARAEDALTRLGELHQRGDLAETRRRYFTCLALMEDRRGEVDAALESARRVLAAEKGQRQWFSDAFGTALEAEWIEAMVFQRQGRGVEARRAAGRAKRSLSKLARRIRDPEHRRVFLEKHPLHRAITAMRLDTPPGSTWFASS